MDKDYNEFIKRMGSSSVNFSDRHDELKHHGILGMKWGVRREIGPNGLIKGNKPQRDISSDYEKTKTNRKVDTKTLSNAELKDLIDRMYLEQRYKDLTKKDISAGEDIARKVVGRVGNRILDKAIDMTMDVALEKSMGVKPKWR